MREKIQKSVNIFASSRLKCLHLTSYSVLFKGMHNINSCIKLSYSEGNKCLRNGKKKAPTMVC